MKCYEFEWNDTNATNATIEMLRIWMLDIKYFYSLHSWLLTKMQSYFHIYKKFTNFTQKIDKTQKNRLKFKILKDEFEWLRVCE